MVREQYKVKQILNTTFDVFSQEITNIRSSDWGKTRVGRLCAHHWMFSISFLLVSEMLSYRLVS